MEKIPDGFEKIIDDFLNDINNTFPELRENIEILRKQKNENLKDIHNHCKENFPKHFFNILYKNEDIFKENELILLPNMDFRNLWVDDISDNTKEVIWKYLQLILFSVIGDINDSNMFGNNTNKLFEAIDEDALKQKLEETINQMSNMFDMSSNEMPNFQESFNDMSGINMNNLPNPEELHSHISELMDGKIGKLANEIAEETAQELDIDLDDTSNLGDVFQKLFKNPGRLMNMVKKVGGKIEDKIKSGEIKESELMEEAKSLMSKMDKMPGMKNFQKMFGDMGFPMNSKMNTSGMKASMDNKIKLSKQKERMLAKLQKRREEKEKNKNFTHTVYNEGEKMQKSKRQNNKKKKKKKKKKKEKQEG